MSGVTRPPDRHPYELYLLLGSLIYGTSDLLDILPTPASIRAQSLPGYSVVWSGLLAAGALTALLAIYWKRTPGETNFSALLVEQVGLVAVGVAAGFYGFALLAASGSAGAYPAITNLGFSLASFAQAWLIQKYIRRVRERVRILLLKQRAEERGKGKGPE